MEKKTRGPCSGRVLLKLDFQFRKRQERRRKSREKVAEKTEASYWISLSTNTYVKGPRGLGDSPIKRV